MECKLEGCVNAVELISEFCKLHKCNEIFCLNENLGSKIYCIDHTCWSTHCSNNVVKGSHYCNIHKCISCSNMACFDNKCADHLQTCMFYDRNKDKKCEYYTNGGKIYCNIHKCKLCDDVIADKTHNYCVKHGCEIYSCTEQKDGENYCKFHKCPITGCSHSKDSVWEACYFHKCTYHSCYRLRAIDRHSNACDIHICRKENCSRRSYESGTPYCSIHKCNYEGTVGGYGFGYTSIQRCMQISIEGLYYCIDHKCNIKNCHNMKENKSYCKSHTCMEIECSQTRYKDYNKCSTHLHSNVLRWIYYERSEYSKAMIADVNNIMKQYLILSE